MKNKGREIQINPMDEELLKYIEDHSDAEPEHLYNLERATHIHLLNGRMCSGHLQGRVLKMLVRMINPRKVLELGTFSGYSALCIAEGLAPGAVIDTVEADDELEDFILKAFSSSPAGEKIRLHISDANKFLKNCQPETYDLIFIDADKRHYKEYYEDSMCVLKPGGFILADNTLWDGHVVEHKSHAPQTEGIMKFNDIVAEDPRVEKVILPLRDGLTLIHKLNGCG